MAITSARIPWRSSRAPVAGAVIDWENPLTNKLVWLSYIGQGSQQSAQNLVGKQITASGLPASGVATPTPTPYGPAMRGGAWSAASSPIIDYAGSPPGFTAISLFYQDHTLTGNEGYTMFARGNYVSESNNQGWYMQVIGPSFPSGQNKYNVICGRNNGAAFYRLTTVTTQTKGLHLFAWRSDGTTRSVLLDGKFEASTTTNAVPVSANQIALYTGAANDPIAQLWCGAWNRVMSDKEFNTLYQEPWQLLKPAETKFLLPPLGFGAGPGPNAPGGGNQVILIS